MTAARRREPLGEEPALGLGLHSGIGGERPQDHLQPLRRPLLEIQENASLAPHDARPTGQLTQRMLDALSAIQRGQAPDAHGWVQRLG